MWRHWVKSVINAVDASSLSALLKPAAPEYFTSKTPLYSLSLAATLRVRRVPAAGHCVLLTPAVLFFLPFLFQSPNVDSSPLRSS